MVLHQSFRHDLQAARMCETNQTGEPALQKLAKYHARGLPSEGCSHDFLAVQMVADDMTRVVPLGLVIAVLFVSAASALEEPPRPDPNPLRSQSLKSDGHPAPLPQRKPQGSNEKFKSENVAPRIAAARAKCEKLLEGAVLDYQYLSPVRAGACGAQTPILVKSIGADPPVVISPPATMNCTLAAALSVWLEDVVQPAAKTLGTSVVRMRNASSYKCRRRYGAANTRISEHAFANALDISEFVLASRQRIRVLGNWPYGARTAALPLAPTLPLPNPRRVAAMLALQDAAISHERTGTNAPVLVERSIGSKILAVSKASANQAFKPTLPPVAQPASSNLLQVSATPSVAMLARTSIASLESNFPISPLPWRGATPSTSKGAHSEAGKADTETPIEPAPPRMLQRDEAATFLHVIHADACKIFETVLGPNANAAHKDHFHFDMKKRRYVKICK